MSDRDLTRLRDMLDAARKAEAFAKGASRELLEKDNDLIGFALLHAIQLVGEAASKVSAEARAEYPQLQW